MIRVANAPVSYGAFEQTVGVLPNVPAAPVVLDAIAAAGYEGTELGPYGYLGTGDALRRALDARGLALAGAFVELDFAAGELTALDATLDLLAPYDAQPVLADCGPRDGDVDLDGVRRAVELARDRGHEPFFHHHMGTRVQTPSEIERLLGGTDVALLLDTGHLTAGGGDPVQALRDWAPRVRHVHLKDVSRAVIEQRARLGRRVAQRRVLRARYGRRRPARLLRRTRRLRRLDRRRAGLVPRRWRGCGRACRRAGTQSRVAPHARGYLDD